MNTKPQQPVPVPPRIPDWINDPSAFISRVLNNLFYKDIKGKPVFKAMGTQTVGTSQLSFVHGLSRTPNVVIIQMTTAGTIWQSATADSSKIYLTADAASRTCNVEVAYIPDNLL